MSVSRWWLGAAGMSWSPSPLLLPPAAGYLSECVTSAGKGGLREEKPCHYCCVGVYMFLSVCACVSGWLIAPCHNGPECPPVSPHHSSRPLILLKAPPHWSTGQRQHSVICHQIYHNLECPFQFPSSLLFHAAFQFTFLHLSVFLTHKGSSFVAFIRSSFLSFSFSAPSFPFFLILTCGLCPAMQRGSGNMD